MTHNDIYSITDIRDRFCISDATVRNWLKTGVIPQPTNGIYTQAEYDSIIGKIESDSRRLKFRASRVLSDTQNMLFIKQYSGQRRELLLQFIDIYRNSNLSADEAVHQLGQRILQCSGLAADDDPDNIFHSTDIPHENDDILGAFYQAMQTLGRKSKSGSFYTPAELMNDIHIPVGCTVCDPCCGSGGILIRTLDRRHNPDQIWAFDIDETALFICRINLMLFFGDPNIASHIQRRDWIFGESEQNEHESFDVIVTNPPWGSRFSTAEKKTLHSRYPTLNTSEACSISLFNALRRLHSNGKLHFFIPESLLSVDAHAAIRRILMQSRRNIDITRLGAAFCGVQSECDLLQISAVTDNPSITIHNGAETVHLPVSEIAPPKYYISTDAAQADIDILNHIYNVPHTTLSADTIFAMGIVTGNNAAYLTNTHAKDCEPIIRGRDIEPYRISEVQTYIRSSGVFQQTAPMEYYRRPKIVYRFISQRLVCALDDSGSLILNSANLIIPTDYPPKVLVCLLNSPIYSYIYRKKFYSHKVLKSHLLALPLPILTADLETKFIRIYDAILRGESSQSDADEVIKEYFGIEKYCLLKNI